MTDSSSDAEKRKLLLSMLVPFMLVSFMWLSLAAAKLFGTDFHTLGIFPGRPSTLTGIFTSPLVHSGVRHLFNNTVPLLILGTALFYFYSQVAFRVILWTILVSGLGVWLTGRPSWHIGASGIVYGLASFMFLSGIIRRHIPLMALSLLVAFIYGEMVWGVFPGFRIDISWESHMFGAFAGVVLAVLFRSEGPQKPVPFYEREEEEEDDGTEAEAGAEERGGEDSGTGTAGGTVT
jgi:membrane associated rhomboid family serine protease